MVPILVKHEVYTTLPARHEVIQCDIVDEDCVLLQGEICEDILDGVISTNLIPVRILNNREND